MGLPFWLIKAPIPTLDASQSTSNTLLKFGSIKTGTMVIFLLIRLKLSSLSTSLVATGAAPAT